MPTHAIAANGDVPNQNTGVMPGYLTKYKSYVALLSQHPQTLSLGDPLVIGETYKIISLEEGDDFTNVGASVNTPGEMFVATGTTPAVWTLTTLFYSFLPSAPVIMNSNDSNFLGEIDWTWYGPGSFTGTLEGEIPLNKTIAFASTTDSGVFASIYSNDDNDSLSLNISDREGIRQDYLSNVAVRIDVYQD